MREFMLDTNVCIRAMRKGGEYLRERLRTDGAKLCLSTIIVHELNVGAELSARPEHHLGLIADLASRLSILDFDSAAAGHAANIRANLHRIGQLIGGNDMLIAGHARSLGLTLITSDLVDFRRVEGLRCEDWLAEDSP